MGVFVLIPLKDKDVALIELWLHHDYIRKWFEPIQSWITEIKARDTDFQFIHYYIAVYDSLPIGFCQYYACADAKEDWYEDIPLAGTYSIDYLIGERDYLGKGLGKTMIDSLVNHVFSLQDARRIIVQPEEENRSSCSVLLSCGFNYDAKNSLYCKTKMSSEKLD